ncbi:MAG TPA: methyltransferase domain-containing protein [Dongiaceae bacterium]|nr:methyltransferase domain-containing protein [Dongiaceae bacterium]
MSKSPQLPETAAALSSTVPAKARIFDRHLLRRRRDRAAGGFDDHGFLIAEIAERLLDRLDDITHRFPLALDLGCRIGTLAELRGGRGGIETMLQADLSPAMLQLARRNGPAVILDEEWLPLRPGALDLIMSNLNLHWVNDLPGALLQIRDALKPDGLFLGAMFGGRTLQELRDCLMRAELAETGGVSPRVSPFAEVSDAAALMQRAGFALPVVDSETVTVTYGDVMKLLADLRGMGEANLVVDRLHRPTRRSVLAHAAALYAQDYTNAEGRLVATFQILFLTGWAPHQSQQQPLKPGSGKTSLKDFLGTQRQ